MAILLYLQVEYAKNMGFGGVMFWSLDIDDFSGDYCKRGRYPLLAAIGPARQITPEVTFAPPTTTTEQKGGFKLFFVESVAPSNLILTYLIPFTLMFSYMTVVICL